MTEDIVQVVAKAIWGGSIPMDPEEATDLAQAALAAIRETHAIVPREPTEAMLEPFGIHRSRVAEAYRAMIAAAEGEG